MKNMNLLRVSSDEKAVDFASLQRLNCWKKKVLFSSSKEKKQIFVQNVGGFYWNNSYEQNVFRILVKFNL